MPDKPKRRKNNKNKRKNKAQNQQNSSTELSSVSVSEVKSHEEKVLTIRCPNEEIDHVEPQKENTSNPIELLQPINDESKSLVTKTSSIDKNENIAVDVIGTDITVNNTPAIGEKIQQENNTKQERVIALEKYKVESPEKVIKSKTKLQGTGKSKSVDNDDQPTIVEILDDEKLETDSSLVINASNVLITEAETEVQWESTSDLKDLKAVLSENAVPGALSVTTIPLITPHCEQTKSMSPEEEKTLRKYLQSLNLSTNETMKPNIVEIETEIENIEEREIKKRLKNKGFTEGMYNSKLGPPRLLHVIDEEVSGESSATSRRHSYLNEKKDETEELEDDVFISTNDKEHKLTYKKDIKTFSNLIPQQCFRVGAQIKDPEISEARGAWTTTKLETLTGAEIVYLTDSSSSTSSTYDLNESEENNYKSDENVRIITPTIEAINTDSFLKNNFTSNNDSCKKYQQIEEAKNVITSESNVKNDDHKEPTKAPNEHEIVILDADSIKTNLYVKDIDLPNIYKNDESNSLVFKENLQSEINPNKVVDQYDIEIKVLKCELNDAINNLIKEVISDSESTNDDTNGSLVRQDSSSSLASSQCTAKYNPKCSSLNDISGVENDEYSATGNEQKPNEIKSHVKDVIETIKVNSLKEQQDVEKMLSLRDICLKTICDLPYGEQIIEELAKVSERLQNMSDLAYATSNRKFSTEILDKKTSTLVPNVTPPPVKPRNSSLKVNREDSRNTLPAQETSKSYNICLSPSHKMLMEKTRIQLERGNEEKNTTSKQKEKTVTNMPIVDSKKMFDVPFKSQTGSRLLALLQNPSKGKSDSKEFSLNRINKSYETSGNLFSVKPKTTDKDTYDFGKRTISETVLNEAQKPMGRSNMFKPIPPPKPRNFSSSFYDTHQSSYADNSFKSIKNENKYFHYSTGNLSKDIEDDISSIQNMHRYYNDIYKQAREDFFPRRPSLPKDLCDQQMEYILQKEKEVEAEIYRLENDRIKTTQRRGPRAPMISDKDSRSQSAFDLNHQINKSYSVVNTTLQPTSKLETEKLSSVFSKSEEELVRNKMYTEYVSQMAEREQRKQQKVIKITKTPPSLTRNVHSKSESQLRFFEEKVNNRIEKEFIDKARERWNKLGFKDPETEDEKESDQKYKEPQVIEHKIKVIDSGEEKDVQKLPNHLQDFVKFTVKDKSDKSSSPGESDRNEASSHGVIVCAVIILVLTVIKYIARLFR